MRVLVVAFLLFSPNIAAVIRDPFSLEQLQNYICDLNKLPFEDLYFVGAIHEKNLIRALIGDPLGHICNVTIGARVQLNQYMVVDILEDEIVLFNGQRYVAIK